MRGLIQKRGSESWRIRVYVGPDASGTKRYVSQTVRGARRDAERELSRLLVEVDEGSTHGTRISTPSRSSNSSAAPLAERSPRAGTVAVRTHVLRFTSPALGLS